MRAIQNMVALSSSAGVQWSMAVLWHLLNIVPLERHLQAQCFVHENLPRRVHEMLLQESQRTNTLDTTVTNSH